MLLFEVEDTGIGLSDEMMSNLFTPFKQAQRRAGGTGLGLYSLAKRIEALGGHYGVRRRRDGKEGSVFWFAIPYVPDLVMAAEAPPSLVVTELFSGKLLKASAPPTHRMSETSSAKAGATVNPNAINILIADDSLTILKMSSMLLRRHCHTVTQAENGAEALKKIAAASSGEEGAVPFDIVLMDFNMPVMDGLEATTRLRALEKHRADNGNNYRQFVVGFSANSDHDTMMEGRAAGMDTFINKPFQLQTFNDVYSKHKNSLNV
jgi:CheY-like chemotaxis protein